MSTSIELVKNQSQDSLNVVKKFSSKKREQEQKTLRSFTNLIKRELKELKQLDGIEWKLSVVSKYSTLFPVLQKGKEEKNLFLGSNSLDVIERFHLNEILGLLQQASILSLSMKQIINKVNEK